MPKYNKAYFIAKFSAIPEEHWCVKAFTDPNNPVRHCALGHCDPEASVLEHSNNDEFEGLQALLRSRQFGTGVGWPAINDGHSQRFPQLTPKLRVLAALNELPD